MVTKRRRRREFGYIRILASGRYQASFVGPDLARHNAPITFGSKDDATIWLVGERRYIEESAADRTRWISPAEREQEIRRLSREETFGEYAERWIGERRNSKGEPLRPLTIKDYRQVLKDYLVPVFGDQDLKDITRSMVREWHRSVAKTASDRARGKAYGLLRAIMNSAVDDELIAASPVHVRGAGTQTRRRRVEPASIQEMGRIVSAMPERLQAAVVIAAWCALRFGELAELRRRDVDLRAGKLKVRRAVIYPKGGAIVTATKSDAGFREVAIPPHVMPIIQRHLQQHVRKSADALLFPAEGGGHLWNSTLSDYFKKAKEAAGRSDLRWHDLRHTGATLAAQAGATTAELQARLGHSTTAAALLYQHTAKNRDRQIADRLSAMALDPHLASDG